MVKEWCRWWVKCNEKCNWIEHRRNSIDKCTELKYYPMTDRDGESESCFPPTESICITLKLLIYYFLFLHRQIHLLSLQNGEKNNADAVLKYPLNGEHNANKWNQPNDSGCQLNAHLKESFSILMFSRRLSPHTTKCDFEWVEFGFYYFLLISF